MRTMVQYFEWYLKSEDNHWKRIKNDAGWLKSLGVSDVWLPPAYKGKRGLDDAGYGVYDLYDLGEFNQKGSVETKYGTKQDYLDAVAALNDVHISVIADVVLNHKMGADRTEEVKAHHTNLQDRSKILDACEIEAWTVFDFTERYNTYSSFKWRSRHFTSVDYDAKTQKAGLFVFDGKAFSTNVDEELGNYDYLMGADVDFNNPEVIDEYTAWGQWYLNEVPVQGFRLDAVKHIQFDFFSKWLYDMRQTRNLFAVGEYWSSDLRALNNYLMESSFSMNLFDVPLHFNLFDASVQKERYDLRKIFNNTLVQNHPEFAVTFVDNHDTQVGQSLESWIEPWFRESANALILLRDTGIPCVFYTDVFDPAIQKMMKLRRYVTGLRMDMFDDANCVGWSYNNENGLVVLMSNEGTRLKKMFVGRHHAGVEFKDALGNCDEVVKINDLGVGMFKVNPYSVSVYTIGGSDDASIS